MNSNLNSEFKSSKFKNTDILILILLLTNAVAGFTHHICPLVTLGPRTLLLLGLPLVFQTQIWIRT